MYMQPFLSFQATFHYTCTKRILRKNENHFAWQNLIKIMGFGAGFGLRQIEHHLLTFFSFFYSAQMHIYVQCQG